MPAAPRRRLSTLSRDPTLFLKRRPPRTLGLVCLFRRRFPRPFFPSAMKREICEKNKKSFEPFTTKTKKTDTRGSSGIKET